MNLEQSVFFIKPYVEPEIAGKTIKYRDEQLKKRVDFRVLEHFETMPLSIDFWHDFYSPIKPKNPVIFEAMCNDFVLCEFGIIGDVLEGNGIIEAARGILGHRLIERNTPETIRGRFGTYRHEGKEYRNIAHSSTADEVEKDIAVLVRHKILNLFPYLK